MATFTGKRTGPGAWTTLWKGADQLGFLWTSDDGKGLGFVASSAPGTQHASAFASTVTAAPANTKARTLFDRYATGQVSGVTATPVVTGDLSRLPG